MQRHHPQAKAGGRAAAPRSGRTSLAPLLLVVWALGLCSVLGLRNRAAEEGFGWIDPSRLVLGDPGSGCDPRWIALFDACTAEFPWLRSDDAGALQELAEAIHALPFVTEVGEPRVLWPDGLELEITLAVPVACIPTGDRFRPVAEDGTLLPGLWPGPPVVAGFALPVVGPLEDADELFLHAVAGDWLAEPEHTAALDVALSLHAHLRDAERALLGPIVIDARRAQECSVEEPGVRITLADGRRILFGRAPSCDEPGELGVERKWLAVAHGLALLEDGDPAHDWEQLDARWDHPEIRWSAPMLAQAAWSASGTGAGPWASAAGDPRRAASALSAAQGAPYSLGSRPAREPSADLDRPRVR